MQFEEAESKKIKNKKEANPWPVPGIPLYPVAWMFRPLAVLSGYYYWGPLAYPQIVYSLFGRIKVACHRLGKREGG